MKLRVILACSVLLTSTAFAASKAPSCTGGKKAVVSCRHHGGPEGPSLEIVKCKNGTEIASVFSPGPGGKAHLSGTVLVTEKAFDPHKTGGPRVWTGKGFEVSTNFTTAPLAPTGGRHLGKFKYGSMHDEVSCALP